MSAPSSTDPTVEPDPATEKRDRFNRRTRQCPKCFGLMYWLAT